MKIKTEFEINKECPKESTVNITIEGLEVVQLENIKDLSEIIKNDFREKCLMICHPTKKDAAREYLDEMFN